MAENKKIQNANRLRYIRALERFSKSIVGYLSKSEAPSKVGYEKKLSSAQKLLDRVQKVDLYKGELKDLENLVQKMQNAAERDDIEEIKKEILYSANQYEKSKNFKRYKKPKHSKNLEEW